MSEHLKEARNNVYLVGPMGVGKTTIGKLLADELKLSFIDTDREIERRTGADIPWIFDVEGEQGFRLRESRVLADLSESGGQILATGGGIVLDHANREIIKKTGCCVYLTADVSQLVSRVGKDKKRPLLQQDNPRSVLERVLKTRDPLYREVATWVVQTDTRPPRQVAGEIVRLIRAAA
ncbi:MAG TPA: shikimate kinase AroK [Pseudomonadales bacterium]|nr:shikimate kinase AroK [Pseudomonadales bacterium]